jgi:rhodanese-related sulfurtransferase
MKKLFCTFAVFLSALFICFPSASAAGKVESTTAKLCGSCHNPEPGVMMGFLDNISLKSGIIQMDIMSHKEVVRFTENTKVKYVKDFADIRNYRSKGFQINFHEDGGEKMADEVIRFDIMKAIAEDEKLSREQFMELRQNPRVKVYDVRPPVKYQMAHIPGAAMMPAPAFDKFISRLPEDKSTPIIFYGVGGCLSPTAAMKTKSLGYENVRIYIGGYPDWVASGAYGITEPAWLQQAIAKDIPHVLIDLRDPGEAAGGHINGAVAIPADRLAAGKDMFPPQKKAPIILYGPGAEQAAKEIRSWGYKLVQVLNSTYSDWETAGNPVQAGPGSQKIAYQPRPAPGTITPAEFKKMSEQHFADAILVDVRNPDEFAGGTIHGAVNIPADLIGRELDRLPADKELVLFCNTGVRAGMAHTALSSSGRKSRYLDATIAFNDNSFEIEQ